MRRRAMPISRLRRDPQHYRFAMPNSVWEYKLKPIEFLIFSYLCYRPSTSTLTPDVISAGIHMTADTVRKHLAALVRKGIVSEDGTPALKCEDVKFFTLPNEVFLLRLPPSAFMVYAYLLLIEDRRTHTCHPSYNTIAAATGLAKNTAIKKCQHAVGDGAHHCGVQQLFRQARDEVERQQPLHNSSGEAGGGYVSPTAASTFGARGEAQTYPPTAKGIRPPSPQRCLVCPDPRFSST